MKSKMKSKMKYAFRLLLLVTMSIAAAISLSALPTLAKASLINGIEYGNGLTLQTGSLFFNVDGDHVIGVGTVDNIRQGDNVIWSYGDNGTEYNFVFDHVMIQDRSDPDVFGNVNYGNILGIFQFYANDPGIFQATGDFATDSALIMSGDLNIDTTGHPVTVDENAWVITGSSDEDSNAGTGQLDVNAHDENADGIVDSAAYHIIVQDALERKDGSFADTTFNYSSDNLLTNGYDWSGSVDMAVVTREVPEPTALLLLGIGLLALAGVKVKTKTKS